MADYKALLKKKAELEIEIENAKQEAAAPALEECKRLIKEFGFTAAQLELKTKGKRKSVHHEVQFRNGDDEFTGFGKRPDWIKDMIKKHGGTNDAYKAELEKFRIVSKVE